MIQFRPPRIAIAFACAAAAVDWLLPRRVHVSPSYPAVGLTIGAIGFLVMLRGWWVFTDAKVAICPTAETVRLITDGIYRVTRSPMYLGLVCMMVGLAVAIGTAPFYGAAVAYFAVIDRVFCRYEKAKLAARFGDQYLAYTRRVRRWL